MKQLLLVISLLFLLAGCAPYTKDIKVKTAVGHNANISDYNSYIWLNIITTLNDPSGKWQPPGLDIAGEIKLLIDRELTNRGIYLNTIDPGLAVAFQLGADMQALKLKTDPKSKLAVLTNVPDAALMVFLIDTESQSIIWIGKAEAELQQDIDAELIRKRIDYTITEMFKQLNKKLLF